MKKYLLLLLFIPFLAFGQKRGIVLLDQQQSIIGGVIQSGVVLSNTISFAKPVTAYTQTTVSTNRTLTPSTADQRAGCGAVLRAIGDGSHTLTFSGFTGSDVFDNTTGKVNLITFLFDGYSYWYTIKK